ILFIFFFQAEDGIRDGHVTGVQTCALPIFILDQDQETLIKLRGKSFTSYAEKFIPPAVLAKQYLGNILTNMGTFLRMDFHMKSRSEERRVGKECRSWLAGYQ